jgi:GGDEF domain-containing protein
MELSSIELNVFVSLTVILGAGLIALIVDYLKGNNEQLRERNIELSVRREEESRRSISEIRLLRERMAAAAGGVAAVIAPREPGRRAEPAGVAAARPPEPESARSTQEIIEQAVERAVRHAGSEKPADKPRRLEVVSRHGAPAPPVEVVRPEPAKVEPAVAAERTRPPGSLLDHVIFATMPGEGGAAAPPPRPAAAQVERIALAAEPAARAGATEPAPVVVVTPLEEPRVPEPVVVVRPQPVPAPAGHAEPEPAAAGFLAPDIAPRARGAAGPAAARPVPAPAAPQPRIAIRSGLAVRRESVLQRGPALVKPVTDLPKGCFSAAEVAALVDGEQPVTGVVVAIGIKDYQRIAQSQSKGAALDLVDSVDRLIRSLISANDFAYRRAEDEFIVIFPNEKGAAAQKRINQVAERLWDFQLRSLAAFSALFSWGAVAVSDKRFTDAVELAADEMSETRGSRRGLGVGDLRARRRAANS